MKSLLVSTAILLGSIASATAQDFYLPCSSKSKKSAVTKLYTNVHTEFYMNNQDYAKSAEY